MLLENWKEVKVVESKLLLLNLKNVIIINKFTVGLNAFVESCVTSRGYTWQNSVYIIK